MFNEYLFPSSLGDPVPQSKPEQLRFVIGRILGTTLNMDWYDLCLINNSFVTLEDGLVKPIKIGKLILPIKNNMNLNDLDFWREHFLSFNEKEGTNNTQRAFSRFLVVEPYSEECTYISPTNTGFLYSGLSYYLNDTPITMSAGQEILKFPQEGRVFDFSNSKFEIRTDSVALWVKRLTLFSIIIGICLLFLQIRDLVYKKPNHKDN